ncbi:hypothetical protein [Atlantibacter hermannii]|uniref:hypothetical protein n=1 Tax=Atlantibacter hermannii TaxID=565 RepID=UPI002FE09DFA
MSVLTYSEYIKNLSDTLTIKKKETSVDLFVKDHKIHLEPLNKTSLENYSQTLEIETNLKSAEVHGMPYTTRVVEISVIQPQGLEHKKPISENIYKKLKARAKEKITFLEKALDTYGVIDEVIYLKTHKEIHARIYDINSHEIIDEISFSSDEFSKSDQRRLVESAIFYWYVGVERTLLGQEKRVSEFRLRRIFNQNH